MGEEAQAGIEAAITAYGIPLVLFTSLNYLGRFIFAVENDWTLVFNNLQRARNNCARLTRVLIREGADARTLGRIYVEVLQAFMIYGL